MWNIFVQSRYIYIYMCVRVCVCVSVMRACSHNMGGGGILFVSFFLPFSLSLENAAMMSIGIAVAYVCNVMQCKVLYDMIWYDSVKRWGGGWGGEREEKRERKKRKKKGTERGKRKKNRGGPWSAKNLLLIVVLPVILGAEKAKRETRKKKNLFSFLFYFNVCYNFFLFLRTQKKKKKAKCVQSEPALPFSLLTWTHQAPYSPIHGGKGGKGGGKGGKDKLPKRGNCCMMHEWTFFLLLLPLCPVWVFNFDWMRDDP